MTARQHKASKDETDNGRTIRPAKSPASSPALPSASIMISMNDDPIPRSLPSVISTGKGNSKEDYSADIDFDERSLSQKIGKLRVE